MKHVKNIYVFGNEYLKEDHLAHHVARHLRSHVHIVPCRTPEDLLDADTSLIILDVTKNITHTRVVRDIAQLKTQHLVSAHDFDLGYFLKLLEAIGEPKDVKIICIPQEGDPEKIAVEVDECLKTL